MAGSRSEDIFLDKMREVLQEPSLSLEQAMTKPLAKLLLDTVVQGSERSSLERPTTEEAEVRDKPWARLPSSRAVIQAAIQDTFSFDELTPNEDERATLLQVSDLVMVGGKRRLRVTDSTRAEILAAEKGRERYEQLLGDSMLKDSEQHEAISVDPVLRPSAWLRCFLTGKFKDLDSAPATELKSAVDARERLRFVTDLPAHIPSSSELARRLGLAELLEPLRVLIGAEEGWAGTPRRDRFVGRDSELTQLRAFVDELSSRSTSEYVTRLSARAANSLTGREMPELMIIEARGGLGKSALLAKFVLDHVFDQSRRFPFAYLDFDRATLDPERPHQILLEITRQIGLQFPEAWGPLSMLAEDIRAELARSSPTENESSAAVISDPFARFVEILREYATFGTRAFLLVLDTMEVVQWDLSSMEKLAELVDEFRVKGLDELRVVASGRADVPELRKAHGRRVPTIHLKLKPLSMREARALAEALGRMAIGDAWISSWSNAIAEGAPKRNTSFMDVVRSWTSGSSDDVRREPLAVRVAVDLILRTEPSQRQEIADEIARAGVDADDDFVARLYERRIVNHVRDPTARKLAWPGLVVRRVTSEIAREVLAPVCGIPPEGADAAFMALGQEIWMVVREGDALRHRPDLRARTLPLMRRKDPAAFDRVAAAAVAYFGTHRLRSREDRAEWLYHRLLAGEDPQAVGHDVTPDVLPMLARAESDFTPESGAASYLTSRTARTRLPPRRIRQLKPIDALYHLSVTASGAFALDDAALDLVALDIADRVPAESESDLLAWSRALWVKTGAWRRLHPPLILGEELTSPLLRAHVFWAARVAPSLDDARRSQFLDECARATSTLRSNQAQRVGFRAMVQAMALARLAGSNSFRALDMQVASMLASMKPNPIASIQAALRTAIVLGERCRGPALGLWVSSRRRGSSERVRNPTVSLAELRGLRRVQPEAIDLLSQVEPENLETPMRFADERTVASAVRALEQMIGEVSGSPDAVQRGLAVARIFASRDEDWIVPFGYAAARATGGRFSAGLSQRLAGYEGVASKPAAPAAERPGDMLAAMRVADEAGDLVGYSRLVLSECVPNAPASADLRLLIDYRSAWSRAIAMTIGIDEALSPTEPLQGIPSERPPAPGPVIHIDDLQKGRWGGQEKRDGRRLRAVLESVERDIFYFSLIVESTDDSVLEPPVIFHLHDSFPRSVVPIRRITEGRRAVLSEWNAYGVFAVGVQVRNSRGKWISLELDLANLTGLPKRFLGR